MMDTDDLIGKPVRKTSARPKRGNGLAEIAYVQLHRKIIDLSLRPGSQISEPEMTALLDATRASVRSALLRLAQEGLVKPVVRQGYIITPLTLKDSLDIAEIRLLVEPTIAFRAAGKITADELEPFREVHLTGYDDHESLERFLRVNREFRIALAKASGNARIVRIATDLIDGFERYTRLSFITNPNMTERIRESYERLSAALVEGRSSDAADLARDMVETGRDAVSRAIMSSDDVLSKPLEVPAHRPR